MKKVVSVLLAFCMLVCGPCQAWGNEESLPTCSQVLEAAVDGMDPNGPVQYFLSSLFAGNQTEVFLALSEAIVDAIHETIPCKPLSQLNVRSKRSKKDGMRGREILIAVNEKDILEIDTLYDTRKGDLLMSFPLLSQLSLGSNLLEDSLNKYMTDDSFGKEAFFYA